MNKVLTQWASGSRPVQPSRAPDLQEALWKMGRDIAKRGARKAAIMANANRLDEANEAIQSALRENNGE